MHTYFIVDFKVGASDLKIIWSIILFYKIKNCM